MVESTTQSSKLTYLVFIRHGEREDHVEEKSNNVYQSSVYHDPALTSTGLSQASQAGDYFKKRVKDVEKEFGVKFDEVRIESSPFLRCLQTAN